jgi:hypothetical protein
MENIVQYEDVATCNRHCGYICRPHHQADTTGFISFWLLAWTCTEHTPALDTFSCCMHYYVSHNVNYSNWNDTDNGVIPDIDKA